MNGDSCHAAGENCPLSLSWFTFVHFLCPVRFPRPLEAKVVYENALQVAHAVRLIPDESGRAEPDGSDAAAANEGQALAQLRLDGTAPEELALLIVVWTCRERLICRQEEARC